MNARSFPSLLGSLGKKTLTRWWRRQRSPLRRARLGLEPLEDRTLLTAVGPGQWWTDSANTVTVHNLSVNWIEVTGGDARVNISPGGGPGTSGTGGYHDFVITHLPPIHLIHPPPFRRGISFATSDSGGDTIPVFQPPPDSGAPTNGDYAVDVEWSTSVPGLTIWSGDAGELEIDTDGSVAPVSISGSVGVDAAGDVGSVTVGGNAAVRAGGNIDDVRAADIPWLYAGGNIRSVSASADITYVQAFGDIGPISAGGNIGSLHLYPANLPWYLADVGFGVEALGSITGGVTAGGNIASVLALDTIAGPIVAGQNIWSISAGNYFLGYSPGDIRGGITAGGDIEYVGAFGDIAGPITAGHGILIVDSLGQIASSTIHAGAHIGSLADLNDPDPNVWLNSYLSENVLGITSVGVTATDNISADISAAGELVGVHAGGAFTGDARAGQDILSVKAGSNIDGTVTAGRDIGTVSAPGDIDAAITAGRYLDGVSAGGSLMGSVQVGMSIGTVVDPTTYSLLDGPSSWAELSSNWWTWPNYAGLHAGLDISAAVSAGYDVVTLDAGRDITGSITAGRDVGWIHAPRSVDAAISAGRDVISVWAGTLADSDPATPPQTLGDVAGSITAGQDLYYVFATQDVTADLRAGHGIASVIAERNVGGDVVAAASVGTVLDPNQNEPIDPPPWDWYDWYGYYGILYVVLPGGAPGGVHAGQDVTGDVTAGEDVTSVTAGGNVAGDVTANVGPTEVFAGNDISGTMTAQDDVTLEAINNVSGAVTSRTGAITLTAGAGVSGNLTAQTQIDVDAHDGDVSGAITAGDSGHSADVTVTTWGSISGTITASGYVDLEANGDITENVTAAGAAVRAMGNVNGAIVGNEGAVFVSAGGNVTGSVRGNEETSITADEDVQANVASTTGDVTVRAQGAVHGNISGLTGLNVEAGTDISGSMAAGDSNTGADIGLLAGGAIQGPIWANGDIDIEATGDITGGVTSSEGEINVTTIGDIAGAVTALGGNVNVEAANILQAISASGTVVVTATGSVSGTITSFDDAVNVHAGGNVDAAVVGSSDVLVQAQGDISGDVTSNHGQTWAFADGSLTGNVFAYGAAVVQADGDVSGNVFAVHGDATVLAWGNISGYIWAVDSTAWVWAGEELNPAGISAMYTVEVIALGPDNSFPFGMDTQVVDLEGDSGAQVFETQLGDSPDFVDQLRQWYDGVAAGDRQTIDDTIAAAWTTGHDIVGAFSALQGAYAESVLLNYMQGSWDAQAHGDWNQFKSWYGNLQPQDKGFWTGDLLSRGLDDGNLLSCANRVLATWDAARSDGSQFLRNQAQWDADLATERAQSRQKAQALLAQRNQFNELAITAGKAWAAEALQLNNQRKVSLLGRPDPKTARQLDVENYITASSDPGFAKNFDITLTNTAQGPSYDAVPRTDAGKALVQQWEQTKKIAGMSAIEKLGYTLNLMVTPQAQGGMREQLVSALGQEVVDRLKGLADPKNLAMMAVIGGGLTWVAGTAAGPIVIPLAGLIGYALLGTQVFEIGEDLYKGLATAIDAQTPDDFNVAAQRISDGVVKAAGTGTDLAAMAMGGAAVGKIANKLKNVKGKPKVTPDGNVKVETEGATQAKLKPTEPPGTATQSRGVWDENPLKRGARIEKRLGQNLPKNFPVIDNFENGIATSIKSLDLAAPTYLKANNVTSKVKGYIDALTGYKGNFKWGAADLRNMPVTGKVLKLAVPPNTANAAQLEALQNLVEYGRLRGITVTIVEIE